MGIKNLAQNLGHSRVFTKGSHDEGDDDDGDDGEDDGNIISLYAVMGRPFELKYRADLFLLSLKDYLKTSKKFPLVHWPDLWFLRFQRPTLRFQFCFLKMRPRHPLALNVFPLMLIAIRATAKHKNQFIAHLLRLCHSSVLQGSRLVALHLHSSL